MSLSISEPSICIPRVFSNITELRIKNVFDELFGRNNIKQIDVIKQTDKNGNLYNKVFIHFYAWPIEHIDTRQKLLNGKEIKIVYEQPWFWKCSASRVKSKHNAAPYIMREEANSDFTSMPNVSTIQYNQLSTSISTGKNVKNIEWKSVGKKS